MGNVHSSKVCLNTISNVNVALLLTSCSVKTLSISVEAMELLWIFMHIFLSPTWIVLQTLMKVQYIIDLWKRCQGFLLQAFHWGTVILLKYFESVFLMWFLYLFAGHKKLSLSVEHAIVTMKVSKWMWLPPKCTPTKSILRWICFQKNFVRAIILE